MASRAQSSSRTIPWFVTLMGMTAAAMVLPACVAIIEQDERTARAFFYGALLLGLLTLLIALTLRQEGQTHGARAQLLTLLGAYTVLPLFAAIPLHEAVGQGTLWLAWFEMVSDFTTTGATAYDQSWELARAVHLWRAMVGWAGGFFIWVTVAAVLAPMNLGGFEVREPPTVVRKSAYFTQMMRDAGAEERLSRLAKKLFPLYLGLSFLVFLGLLIAGEDELVALCHAMSTLSTSGISPIGGLGADSSGLAGEMVILLFLGFALSRSMFSSRYRSGDNRIWRDPEMGLGLLIGFGVALLLFARHWLATGGAEVLGGWSGLRAIWGAIFTSFSFLTTTGFVSDQWGLATAWSGLSSPGLALIGLALIGGGVGTTAGGVKLLRVYALGQHSRRELQRLVLPNSVGGRNKGRRSMRKQGAFIAWILFMLFAISNAAVMTLLSFFGVQFEDAMVLSVAALANCGPLAEFGAELPLSYAGLPAGAQGILAAAMVAGRLEALALIALINPEIWRR